MIGYLAQRLAGAVAVVAVTVVLTFMIVRWVPGDPARLIAGMNATDDQVSRIRAQLGLTKPLGQQFYDYVTGIGRGDLGASFVTGEPISEVIAQRLPLTVQLALGGLVFVLLVGFPLGVVAGSLQHRRRWRRLTSAFAGGTALVGAVPEYIAGAFLTFVFSLSLRLLPVQGGTGLTSMILPTVAVGAAPAAILARLVRNETIGVLSQEYITTAAAKRLSRPRLLLRHVLPNVATSTLTLGGLILVGLLGGAVITENVFNISGLGTGIVQGILHNDYPTVQGILLVLGAVAVGINLVVDSTLALLDPRVLTRAVP
jgi:peptide/nickel transport system permease protein